MDKVLAKKVFLINEETEEIFTSYETQYPLEELTELIIKTLHTEKDIYTTFEVGGHDLEGVELELSLYCKNKPSFVERYMDPFLLIHGWLEDTVVDLCIKQSDEVLLSRAKKVVQDYPDEIIKAMNGTEYFESMELHKALMESNAPYQECVEHYMIDHSMLQIEKNIPYIKNKKYFYEELEKKSINIFCDCQKKQETYYMNENDLRYILFTNLDYNKIINDINYHKETMCLANFNFGLNHLEIMLNNFLHTLKPTLNQKDKRVLIELNRILNDVKCSEEKGVS